ncbi:MAG: Alanine-tRNA ligase [Candidatus Azambacteria bacterium GW2011_GWC2_45_7b]|uniref:alanine--tRNA ligase n=3 Tax=Parcubacteria group TaxID=1794811 RepID=A0A837IGX2_9BACT|nr:MAG: Alanine-tRNA ligase [Parcubacteria group bacterium GW2011_GWC1_44_10]KKT59992.1 MAG: Alanine-tRNA ligase [Candidatus Giovannonibacteria bacterium GW2011_GWA1_44_25]KKU12617.1 MAG: Alanine-tRNA ligase [Candidatus Azambacteria bacterium GW2011_GWC2_45_7b]KKU30110.1 MAG: Alanine-tRNA ligase [Candidatus Giovannonibacteria bacterium GW2011_GWB1_46_20]
MIMSASELREKFLDFFKEHGHKIVPSSSLIPDDPSVLLTTAGMQQFKPYFLGKADPIKDFGGKRATSIQKCFRTSDIDEVGDESHLTFFEMLGHFSFGDYFKKETIAWTYELLTEIFNIAPERISATVFAGDEKIPFDKESYNAWAEFLPSERIRKGSRADNMWGPAGPEGPCGAANEVYVDNLEVATLVFMEYFCAKDQSLTPLPQKGVDVGWGFERLAMIVQGTKTIFETDLFEPIAQLIKDNSGSEDVKGIRIVADHVRAATFMIADGIKPSNTDRGYILRRLLRRARYYYNSLGAYDKALGELVDHVVPIYKETNYGLNGKIPIIDEIITSEEMTFSAHLGFGKKLLEKIIKNDGRISGENAFLLHSTYGYPFELILDIAKENNMEVDENGFQEKQKAHQEISRAGVEKKFGGHGLLLDNGELKAANEEELKKVTRLHTATHLLQAALRKVLGEGVKQAGSDITAERTRFDFTFERKLTDEEIKKVEDSVNFAISQKYDVQKKEMPHEDAIKSGALHFFKEKYPPMVNVYSVGNFKTDPPEIFSRELCGGPHVKNTSEIGRFKILKQEPVGSGLRRLRATVY